MPAVYAPLCTVDSVAITPTWLRRRPACRFATAALAPGPITPTTSTCKALRIAGKASAEAVLHATTSILIPCAARNLAFSTAYLSTVASDFEIGRAHV